MARREVEIRESGNAAPSSLEGKTVQNNELWPLGADAIFGWRNQADGFFEESAELSSQETSDYETALCTWESEGGAVGRKNQ